MTEDEYGIVTDLALVRAVRSMLRGVMAVDENQLGQVLSTLRSFERKLEGEVSRAMHPEDE